MEPGRSEGTDAALGNFHDGEMRLWYVLQTIHLDIASNLLAGLRCPQNIIKGQFIDLYLGEIITETELESRELATDGAPSYIFSLDWFQQKDVYYVDSLNFGTPTRFLNHSCNPNCRVFTVILNHADKKVYGLAFFATRDIPAGTELNIDYNPQEAGKVYPRPQPGDDAGVVLCQCGSRNCRVRLWPGPKMKKGKDWARS